MGRAIDLIDGWESSGVSIRQLRVFVAIVRERSLGGAALVLGCAQATVSHHLATLEECLGTPLVIRHSRGTSLTDRGELLLAYAERIVAELERAERAVRAKADLREGSLRIGSFASAGATFLPELLARFSEAYPDIHITVIESTDRAHTAADVRLGRLDVGLVFATPDESATTSPDIASHALFTDPYHLVVHRDHRFAKRDAVRLDELKDERWIVARGDVDPTYRVVVGACRDAGFEPDVILRSDDYTMVGNFIAKGLGLALIPRLGLPQLGDRVAVLALDGQLIARRVQAIVTGDGRSTTATAFMRTIVDFAHSRGW